MKRIYYIFFLTALSASIITGCKKSFQELNVNENKPSSVPASLLFNGVLNDMTDQPYSMYERWGQYFCCNYDYYGNNRYDFGSGTNYYSTLKNVTKMEEEAIRNGAGVINPYGALAKFFKAYLFTKMSMQMGDIPMTEALKGAENLLPAYDPQKEVFRRSFAWLDSANSELAQLIAANNFTLAGDIYYDNDLTKWRKAVNTLRLRLLIELSKKESDADLNIKQQFSTIVSDHTNYPVMESMDDNLTYRFVHPTNDYPMNPGNFGFDALRYNTSATYISLLTQNNDPRVFVTAEPATALVSGGMSPTSFSAFVGASPGEDLGTMYVKANSGQYSLINRYRYYQTYTGEPSIQIGYPEMLFNIAEAINRGWISSGPLGDAESHYKAGIRASMGFYGIPESGNLEVNFLQSGTPGTNAAYNKFSVAVDFNTFYSQVGVQYAGNNANGLNQILIQKYISLFRHSGLEGYYQNRRTGVPAFTTGPGTGNGTRIAKRFQYFGSETTANTSNYQAALQSQYGGQDDINALMWILK
ncbi:MAG: SusD/RagB family nutrient-binding outer membrane lipoprotein [Terrimonas sp.]|nr:SusD/RagB family nutrient-binding outer membrane lipoprotein [Terrimonas sp.]